MLAAAAEPLLPVAKADAVAGEEAVVWPWLQQLVQHACHRGWLNEGAATAVISQLPGNAVKVKWDMVDQALQLLFENCTCWGFYSFCCIDVLVRRQMTPGPE